ncbi:hypothetical protein [Natronobeatus ordinarius]|uniref:hypothetical protein n=1 Tax=Natronobeatus ordinarius TaxID=2963433 RepID=UPI0020CCD1B8|nr:hypothetical protein [Natronobeatus ordinarius]
MNTVGRRLVLGALLVGCLALLASGAVVVGDAERATTGIAAATEDDAANETVRHQHPEEYGETGDLDGVQRWLERELGSQLGESTLELSQGEYDAARQLIDEEYRGRFAQLVEVDGETGNYETADDEDEADDEPTPDERFEEVRDEQAQLIDLLEAFDETRDAYEDAVNEGDEELARELARELEALAAEIEALSDSIVIHFERLDEATGVDFSESVEATTETNQRVQDEQTVIRLEQFEETELTVDAVESISFLTPLEATATLTTADGTPVANQSLTLEVAGDARTVHTDDAGTFAFRYRPVDEPLSTTALDVRYRPDRTSAYLGGETTVPVSIDQVEPTVTIDDATADTAYGESINVSGELAVDDVPVDGVALEVAAGDVRLGDVRVTNGSFDGAVETPATIPDGEHELTARLPFDERALAATTETTPITVHETETALSIDHAPGDDDLEVSGTLETVDGDGVPDQPIELAVDGAHVATATTGPDGAFEATVHVPADADEAVTLAATFDGRGTNLAPAEASTSAPLESPATGSSAPTTAWSGWLAGATVLVGLALVAGGGWWYRRRRAPEPATDATDVRPDDGGDGDESSSPTTPEPLASRAAEYLVDGRPNTAIQTGYAAVRRTLRREVDDDRTLTHWEFYGRYRGQDGDDLRAVTEAYERATFTPEAVPEGEAASVLERVHRLCGLEPSATAEVADD